MPRITVFGNFREDFACADTSGTDMASIFQRRQKWWVKFRHPATGQIIRESLDTHDPCRAEVLRQNLELRVALLDPRLQSFPIPERIQTLLGLNAAPDTVTSNSLSPPPLAGYQPTAPAPATMNPVRRATVDEAVAAYLKFIAADNTAHHVANKISMLRRFLGPSRVEKIGGPVKKLRRLQKDRKSHVPDLPPGFTGIYLDEITPTVLQNFIEGAKVGRVTMRHYRTFFHHFFAVCLKLDLHHPTSFHRPNPVCALPGYLTRNRKIVFLTEAQVQEQLDALNDHPALRIAAAIMIYAGVRRSEALWLTRDAIAGDLSYLSVVNRVDEDTDLESSLKTGERTVAILPPLKAELERYLKMLDSKWVIPNNAGKRWRPDSFTSKLRGINKSKELKWTCLAFRHTYATQRAAEGWPLFRIAKEMGNSVAIVEQYYAGYIRPEMSHSQA